MSGPKKADVQRKLDRAMKSIESQVNEMNESDRRFSELSGNLATVSHSNAKRELASLAQAQSLLTSSSVSPSDRSRLEGQIAKEERELRMAESTLATADSKRVDARLKQERASREIADCLVECENLAKAIRHKQHYLQTEDRAAEMLRERADSALQAQKQVGREIRTAADETRNARNQFDSIANRAAQIQAEVGRAVEDARRRAEAKRIAVENQRVATEQQGALRAASQQIGSLNHTKFAPGQWNRLQSKLDTHAKFFGSDQFENARNMGGALVSELEMLLHNVQELQTQWTNARNAAANDLQAARSELQTIDRNKLELWAGDSVAVASSYLQIDAAQSAFDAEQFSQCQSTVESALKEIRDFSAVADQNERQSMQRQEIAQAIMQTLYDQNYDAPQWYLSGQTADGQPDPLSGMVIFAKSPGEKGDMRMSIDLSGTVDLEVQNIPEGEESMCHKLITGLQQGLAGEIDFAMTDWGRAAIVKDGPLNVPKTRTQEQHRTIERES